MISARWYKVWSDLWDNRTRTLLIVLSIAVGLFAIGTIISARSMLSTEMARSYQEIAPSSGIVRTVELFDEAFVRSVRAMPQVADADARRVVDVRVRVGRKWMSMRLFAVEDYDGVRVDRIRPEAGAWPPPEREILIERSALDLLGLAIGDDLTLELSGERERTLAVAGTAHDMIQVPATFDGTPYGYVSVDTLAWFGEPHGLNELHVVAVAAPPGTDPKAHARQVTNAVKTRAEKIGLTIPSSLSVEPGMLPLGDILDAVLLLLGVLGGLSLLLSVFLIVNTISALLAQQRRQIGVIKAIGGRSMQVMGLYLALVSAYGCLALAIAVPPSILGARALSRFMAELFNFDLVQPRIPALSFAAQVVVGLLAPVLSSLYPFLTTLKVTAAEAMGAYRTGQGGFGGGAIDRLLSGTNLWFARHTLMRPLLLSLRNVFRSKGRLLMTLATLSCAGAIFCGVFSVRASLDRTMDDLLGWWNYDVTIVLGRPYRARRLERETLQVPGVAETDIWLQLAIRRVRSDGSESGPVMLFAPYADSKLVPSPTIIAGRWLVPEDQNAIVVNSILLQEEPDLRVGDDVVFKTDGREFKYRIVGTCMGILAPMAYANYPYIAHVTGQAGQAGAVLVATQEHDPAIVSETADLLEERFDRVGLHVADVQMVSTERAEAEALFGIVVALLMIMAALLALVGGLGLMGTMSINVIERTREIGVLRAIGASNRGVAGVFIREGVAIGLLSWIAGALLSWPLGRMLSDAVGTPIIGTTLSFSYSLLGVGLWLGLVVLLSALASLLPARRASRLTVRQVLAYE